MIARQALLTSESLSLMFGCSDNIKLGNGDDGWLTSILSSSYRAYCIIVSLSSVADVAQTLSLFRVCRFLFFFRPQLNYDRVKSILQVWDQTRRGVNGLLLTFMAQSLQ